MTRSFDLTGKVPGEHRGRVYRAGGGGGGGGAGAASAQATAAEQQRQARIQQAQDIINHIFQGGGAIYSDPAKTLVPGTGISRTVQKVIPDNSNNGYGAGAGNRTVNVQEDIPAQYTMAPGTLIDPARTGFTDDYFNQRKQASLDYYTPQLEDQYQKAKEQLTYSLARAGLLRSSEANKGVADLTQQYDLNKADVAGKAQSSEDALRNEVENQRQTLLQQAVSSQDPALSSNLALASQRNIADSAPGFSPLGELFKAAAYGASSYLQGKQTNELRRAAGIGTKSGTGMTVNS